MSTEKGGTISKISTYNNLLGIWKRESYRGDWEGIVRNEGGDAGIRGMAETERVKNFMKKVDNRVKGYGARGSSKQDSYQEPSESSDMRVVDGPSQSTLRGVMREGAGV